MHFLSNSFMQYEAQCWVKQKKHDTHQNRDNEKKKTRACVMYCMKCDSFSFVFSIA